MSNPDRATDKPPGPFQPGDLCGPYEIVREHDRGGMAIIYEAISPMGDRRAIKVLQPTKSFTKTQLKRFWQEIELLRGIVSDYVVGFYEAGQHGQIVWLALEFLEGDTLAQLIAQQRAGGVLTPVAILHLAIQLSRGLIAIHNRGVVHRDLKPENIMVDSGMIKILDFGIAKYEGITTTDGAPPATLAYMSPEQAAAEKLDGRTDIFNVGLILYELITGRHALGIGDERTTRGDVFAHIMKCEVTPLTPGECEPRLATIVHKALERDRERRFSSAQELHDALVALLRGQREEVWAKTMEATSAPRPVNESGQVTRRPRPAGRPHLRLVRDTTPDPPARGRDTTPDPPARVLRNDTKPMEPERLAAMKARPLHDTVPLPESERQAESEDGEPKRLGSSSPSQRPRRRSAVSRTLFMSFQRQTRRERWLLGAGLLLALLAIPIAWYLGRQAPADAEPQLTAEPPVTVTKPAPPTTPTPVRIEESSPAPLSTPAPLPSASAVPTAVAGPTSSAVRPPPASPAYRTHRPTVTTAGEPDIWGRVDTSAPAPTTPAPTLVHQPKPAPTQRAGRTDHGF